MFDRLNKAIEETDNKPKRDHEDSSLDESDVDAMVDLYDKSLIEYNKLFEYFRTISDKFSEFQVDFQREPVGDVC